jgi:hypothetical protein
MKKQTWIVVVGFLFLLTTVGLATNAAPPKKRLSC